MEENDKSFEAYFHGKMSSKETLDFETALKANSQLKSDYEFYVAVKRSASEIKKDELRSQIDDINLDKNGEEQKVRYLTAKKKSTKVISLLKSAVAVAALFIVGFWGYNVVQAPSTETLFAQNFAEYTPQFSRGENAELPTIDKSELNTPELKLMYASDILSQSLESTKYEEAIKILFEITDMSMLRDQKYWYLGLAHLKIGDIPEAKKHFIYLQSISNYKKKEITTILSALNK